MLILFESSNQRRRDFPAFPRENVVGAAGGKSIHGFQPDPLLCQRMNQARRWEAQPGAGAEQQNFQFQSGQRTEVFRCHGVRCCRLPFGDELSGQHDQAVFMAYAVDRNVIRVVSSKKMDVADGLKMQFHCGCSNCGEWRGLVRL